MSISGFVAPSVTPPAAPLPLGKVLATLARNPIEAMPQALYEARNLVRDTGRTQSLWTSDPDTIKVILQDEVDAFPKGFIEDRVLRPALGDGLLTAHGEHWRWQRRASAGAFSPRAVAGYAPAFAAAAEATARAWRQAGEGARIDVMPAMQQATFQVICDTMLSGDAGFQPARYAAAIERYLQTIGHVSWSDFIGLPIWFPRLSYLTGGSALIYMRRETARVVAARMAAGPTPTPDLLDALIGARDAETGRAMSLREVTDNVLTIINAGHETTALALTWALYLLANDQDAQDRAAAEASAALGGGTALDPSASLNYCRQVLEEAMRLYPPVSALGRQAARPVEIAGVTLRRNAMIMIAIYPMHRAEPLWPRAHVFDPDRFAPEHAKERRRYQYLPFGAGPRICAGAAFALAEGTAILAQLLAEFRVAPDPSHAIRPRLRITLRPEGGMPLYVSRR